MDEYGWVKQRELMWITYIAPHQDPKKMAKRKEQFLPLNGEKQSKGGVTDEMKERFLNEFRKYQDKIKS
jgi:hypothetical protein